MPAQATADNKCRALLTAYINIKTPKVMKKTILALLAVILPMLAAAQDSRPFDVKVVNDEYKIYIRMNLHDKNLTVPGQDVLGQVDGYIASTQSRSTWIIIASEIVDERTARIEVVNDYGSEDFTAEVKLDSDGTYSYRKTDGSTLKFAVKGKWQKIPSTLQFVKK